MAFIGPYQIYTIDGVATVARVQDWNTQATSVNAGLVSAKAAAVAEANANAAALEASAVASAKTYTDARESAAVASAAAYTNARETAAVASAKTYTDAREIAAVASANAYTNGRGFISAWKANTAYAAGERVVSPKGDIVSAKVAFTSGATYTLTNWNPSIQDGRLLDLEAKTNGHETRVGALEAAGLDAATMTWAAANALTYRGLLGTTHLDTVTDLGFYLQTSLANASVENGYPEGVSRGFAINYKAPGSTLTCQMYISTFRGLSFMREKYSGTWTAWVPVGAGAEPAPTEVVFTDQEIVDLAMAQIAGNDESVFRGTLNSNIAVELTKQLPLTQIPIQVIAGTNMATARPVWAGPVYWIVTTPGGIPTNKAAGDIVLETTAGSI